MSLLTSFLKLFKWDTSDANDLEEEFDIDTSMNDNWDKLDKAIEDLDTNKVEKVEGKGLSTNDFTNEDKEKLDSLENYDDSEIKQDIADIQDKDKAQDTQLEKLKDNCINITTEEATSLQVTDASTLPAKLDVRGNHSQEVTETQENIFNGKLESGAWDYASGQKADNATQMRSVDYIDVSGQTQISIVKKDGGTFTVGVRYYADDKTYIGRASISNVTDATTTTIVNNLDDSKTVKYATLTFTHSTDTSEVFGVNKGADLTWHDFIPNSPSLDYPSEVRAVGDNVNIFPDDLYNYFSSNQNAIKELNGKEFKITTTANRYSGIYLNSNNDFYKDLTNKIKEKIITYSFDVKADSDIQLLFGTTGYETIRNVNNNWQRLQVTYEKKEPGIYFYNSSATVTTFYIRNIKLIFGEGDNLYSPYGQGSVEIKKINKNWAEIDTSRTVERSGLNIEVDNEGVFTLNGTTTANMYINLLDISEYQNTTLSSYKIPVKKYKAYFELISKNNSDGSVFLNVRNFAASSVGEQATTYCAFDNLIAEDVGIQIKDCNITKDRVVAYLYIASGAKLDDFKFKFALYNEDETDTTYEKHQEQSLVLDIQKPMLQGDYFVKESDGWKEVHGFNKKIFDGTENIGLTNNQGSFSFLVSDIPIDTNTAKIPQLFSNCYEACSWEDRSGNNKPNTISYYYQTIGFDKGNLTTVDEFKQLLSQKNAEGNSVYVYYPLATPSKLACTEAQSKVLDQLNELDLFKGTNNIITAESLALMQMSYIVDTETYIDNRIDEKLANINQQLLEIVGGN